MSRTMSLCMRSIQNDVWSPADTKNVQTAGPKHAKSSIFKRNEWFFIDFLVRTSPIETGRSRHAYRGAGCASGKADQTE